MAIHNKIPFQCHLWQKGAPTAKQLLKDLVDVATYEDDSHLIRKVKRCRKCRQLYFYEFYEEIDWVGGNDPQYRTWIPIEDEDSAEELSSLSPLQLLRYSGIRSDFPSDADHPIAPRWVTVG